uniref:G-protein coupled receptors family 1 profile domain-containing protein n=1 Tax=Plectus sambesii TaxID=2011161 RepID=A0A914VG82_9BILA
MRKAAGTFAEFSNISWPANPNITLPITLDFLISNIGGVPANLLVLYISFFNPLVTGHYKYFLANLALCDLSYCFSALFSWAFHIVHYLADIPMNATKCSLQTIFPYMFGFCMVTAIPLASISQFIVLVRGKNTWLTRNRAISMCCIAYLPAIWPLMEFTMAPYVVQYSRCNYSLYIPFMPEIILFFLLAYFGPTLIFCNVSIYRNLSKHIASENTRNEKSVLKAVVIQAVVPLICCVPVVIVFASVAFYGWDDGNAIVLSFSDDIFLTWMDFCFYLFELTPLTDALITLTVVKQYRTATRVIMNDVRTKLRCRKRRIAPASIAAEESESSMQGQGNSGHTFQAHIITEL